MRRSNGKTLPPVPPLPARDGRQERVNSAGLLRGIRSDRGRSGRKTSAPIGGASWRRPGRSGGRVAVTALAPAYLLPPKEAADALACTLRPGSGGCTRPVTGGRG